ncbi:hypothetical protein D3C72_2360310 [compost metagenome]
MDLRGLVRRHPTEDRPLVESIEAALLHKPLRHEFAVSGEVQVLRFMNATGG